MHQSNIELVTDIMNFSEHGGMSQLVVMEAIDRYVNMVVDGGLEKMREHWGENHLISPDVWFATCEEIKQKLDGRGEKT